MGKRKGKPKAKTKDEHEEDLARRVKTCDDGSQQKMSNCRKLAQTFVSQKAVGSGGHETKLVGQSKTTMAGNRNSSSFERELREKLEQVGATTCETRAKLAPPLISISIAPASARGSRSASCATTTNSTWSLKSIGKQRDHLDEDEVEVSVGPEQVRAADEQSQSRLGSVSSCEVFSPDDNQAPGEEGEVSPLPPPTTSGLELVRSSYIRLVRHNSLQYFYLGVLVYSVICMILLPILLQTSPPPRHASQTTAAATDNCDNYDELIENSNLTNKSSAGIIVGFLLIALPSIIALLAVIALKFLIELKRHLPARRRRQQQQQQTDFLDTPLSRAQTQNTNSQTTGGGGRSQFNDGLLRLPHYLQVLAIHLCLWLIVLPTGFIYYLKQQQQLNDCKGQTAAVGQTSTQIPIILLSVSAYLLPYLTSEILTRAHNNHNHLKRFVISTCLPIAIVILLRGKLAEHFPLTLLMIVLTSLAGQLRHGHLMALVRSDTFGGASELIEAKVSLEQQRQQQETLLLSVLPAYVAEQVKRTMVKKMESVRGENDDDHQLPPGTGTGAPGNHQDNGQVQVLVSTANATTQTVHGPAHCGRSLTLAGAAPNTELQVQSEPLPNNGGGGSQLKVMLVGAARDHRHSFARASRLSSSLASGAAYISEALLNNVHPIGGGGGKPVTTTSSAVQMTGPHVMIPQVAGGGGGGSGPALLPVSNSLNMQQQSRRGFNELYIRTYNNVSLLYGDIVGFTRLCTQLSSSQLVRVLNNLFSHFDHLAERHRIMRIKILGDCYYGVSGIPEFAVTGAKSSGGMHKMHSAAADKGATSGVRGGCSATGKQVGGQPKGDNHAINCVNMGLDMIQYIKRVNIGRATSGSAGVSLSRPSSGSLMQQQQQQPPEAVNQQLPDNFELNMRIGIHTGHIHSGVIGLKKWQFDVWSNDVSIAMHCESSGVAGRVQVTEATAQHLRGAFTLEPACTRSSRDTFLADRDIQTYLIRERVYSHAPATPTSYVSAPGESAAPDPGPGHQQNATTDEERIREATIGTIRQTLLALRGDDDGSFGLVPPPPSHPMSGCGLAELEHNDIRLAGLTFRDPTLNRQFDERSQASGNGASRHLCELLLLFVILVPALHLVDYLVLIEQRDLDSPGGWRPILLGASLVGLCLLLVALPKPRMRAGTAATSGRSSCYLGSGPSRTPSLLTQQHKSSFMSSMINFGTGGGGGHRRMSTTNWSLNDGGDVENASRRSGSSSSRRLVKLLSELPVARKWCRDRHFSTRQVSSKRFTWLAVNNRLALGLILLTFLVAIISQARLVLCANEPKVAHELQQLTVLLVLVALDLSPSLWGYRTRCCLLASVILLQVASLALVPGLAWSDNLVAHLRQSLCPTTSDLSDDQRDLPTPDHHHSRMLINSLSDALLLVLALWSLAYQRQVECAQRCNFLWRNRLNVDHEELEYISGINKVLLENILPSHVVQHYLAQPAVATTTSGPVANTNAHKTGEKHTQQPVGLRRPLAKSPSVASSASTQLVRMSVGGQLSRGPLRSNTSGGSGAMSELYHEQHESVAVMFASIPHFYEFYDESDISKQGLGCIALLNEIICDFDKLLLKNKFSRIEKIKTIGSTYMAAAGLRPAALAPHGLSPMSGTGHLLSSWSARNSTASQVSQQTATSSANAALDESSNRLATAQSQAQQQQHQLSQQKMNLICMIQFATSLMSALNGINKQSFQVFKLRVGVNAGPVIAGIIGAQRPFYDIWGDCVNIASRMESLGEVGRIQVEERTAKLLMECLCTENYVIRRRGPIDVKGKGGMVTYFVDKREVVASVAAAPGQWCGESCPASRQSSASPATTTVTQAASKQNLEQQQVAATNKQPVGGCGGQSDEAAAAAQGHN